MSLDGSAGRWIELRYQRDPLRVDRDRIARAIIAADREQRAALMVGLADLLDNLLTGRPAIANGAEEHAEPLLLRQVHHTPLDVGKRRGRGGSGRLLLVADLGGVAGGKDDQRRQEQGKRAHRDPSIKERRNWFTATPSN
ncbi:hypothetical protein WR25_21422 [Diploscapter pachys]|uniref:Uncharacterized protein n=1 Tax=Diploscapter pachys TaxID=2018661 RepID=A0A2A2K8E1_9BILA|nr:hypothetical protein WR25_21422 [Diploscapter pachys]